MSLQLKTVAKGVVCVIITLENLIMGQTEKLNEQPHSRKELVEYQVKQLIDILEQEGLL